jgi:hypothetical protein
MMLTLELQGNSKRFSEDVVGRAFGPGNALLRAASFNSNVGKYNQPLKLDVILPSRYLAKAAWNMLVTAARDDGYRSMSDLNLNPQEQEVLKILGNPTRNLNLVNCGLHLDGKMRIEHTTIDVSLSSKDKKGIGKTTVPCDSDYLDDNTLVNFVLSQVSTIWLKIWRLCNHHVDMYKYVEFIVEANSKNKCWIYCEHPEVVMMSKENGSTHQGLRTVVYVGKGVDARGPKDRYIMKCEHFEVDGMNHTSFNCTTPQLQSTSNIHWKTVINDLRNWTKGTLNMKAYFQSDAKNYWFMTKSFQFYGSPFQEGQSDHEDDKWYKPLRRLRQKTALNALPY